MLVLAGVMHRFVRCAGTVCLRVRACRPGGGAAPVGLPPGRARQAARPKSARCPPVPSGCSPCSRASSRDCSMLPRTSVRTGWGRTAWRAEGVPLKP